MSTESTPKRGHRARGAVQVVAISIAAIVVTCVAAAFYIVGDATSATGDAPPTALLVTVRAAEHEDGYTVQRRYVGRIEPRRRSAVGFELAGELKDLLIDDGELVSRGAVIARLDTQRLVARRAEFVAARAEAAAAAELARATFERALGAFQRGAVSEQELDEREEARDGAIAALDRIDRQIESVDVDLDKSTLRSPFDAVVARRLADEGQVIEAGTPVFDLYERTSPEARVGVPATAARALQRNEDARVFVHDDEYDARVRELLPVTARGTRTIEVVLELHAELDGLRAGDLATITVDRRIDEPGFWLPIGALTESARGLWACFIAEPIDDPSEDATHRLARRQLEVLHTQSDRVFVSGTLSVNERVVIDGLQRLVSGQTVRITPAKVDAP